MNVLSRSLSGSPEKPAVLFLHGFMGSSTDWQGVVATLEARAFCIAPDLPGHGASLGLTPEAYTMEGAAQAVVRTLDELGVELLSIVGYSMGGRLALYLALRYPELCAGLFLESASPGLESGEERRTRREADEEKAKRLESGGFEEFLGDWYRQPLFASLARDEGLLRRTIETRRRNDPVELARSLRGMGTGSQPSLWRELEGLAVHVFAVAGGLDEKFAEVSSRMARISPRVEPVVIPGVGHNVHDEAPAEYVALLGRFLDRSSLALGEAEPVP
jgi:2-succinyl-6-hydroxy-2,4-cyclohexadiene-1-carboxylate synthase